MKNIVSALIVALAIVTHAVLTKPPGRDAQVGVSKHAFAKATKEIVADVVRNSERRAEFIAVDVEGVRFAHSGALVLVEYVVRLKSTNQYSGLVFRSDEFGRYSAAGNYEGSEFSTLVK